MAIIRGSRFADELWGTDGSDRIFGGKSDDQIAAGTGDFALGGQGNDFIFTEGTLKDDDTFVPASSAWLVGGAGHDTIIGFGFLRGDEQAKMPERFAGNDVLVSTMGYNTDLGTQRGGLGHDTFDVSMTADGHRSQVDVLDFRPGEDKVALSLNYADGGNRLGQAQIFGILDTNGNGRLGDDVPWDGNSQTYSDIANNQLIVRLHEDWTVIQGVTHIDASDWMI